MPVTQSPGISTMSQSHRGLGKGFCKWTTEAGTPVQQLTDLEELK